MNVYKISVEELRGLLPKWFRYLNINLFYDRVYCYTDLDDWLKICKEALEHARSYVVDEFDCDDFSRWLKCYSTKEYLLNGIARVVNPVKRHSYNLIVAREGNDVVIVTIEPQTAEVVNYLTIFSIVEW